MAAQQTIVITGSASGMGRATAEVFLENGWRVIGLDVVESDIAHEGSGELYSRVVDIRSRETIAGALESVLGASEGAGDAGTGAAGAVSRIDAVANIAGVYPPTTLDNYDEETYRRIFDINVLGTVNVIAAARPYLGEGSTIITFASQDAYTVSPGQLFYGASKAAVTMLTKTLALELAPAGIRVNGIAPGWVATPGNAATGRMEAVRDQIPLGRVAEPREIAEWVLLLSDTSRTAYLTGETILLSGGFVLR